MWLRSLNVPIRIHSTLSKNRLISAFLRLASDPKTYQEKSQITAITECTLEEGKNKNMHRI